MIPLNRCGAIVVAAGRSTRYGAGNKLTAPFRGYPLLSHALSSVAAIDLAQVVVVVDRRHLPVLQIVERFGFEAVLAPETGVGLAASIATGAGRMGPHCEGIFVALGDMPFVVPNDYSALAHAMQGTGEICRAGYESVPGHPVLFGRSYLGQLTRIEGDDGAGAVIRQNAVHLSVVDTGNCGVTIDLDTQSDFDLYS